MQYLPCTLLRAQAAPRARRGWALPRREIGWGQERCNHDARGKIIFKDNLPSGIMVTSFLPPTYLPPGECPPSTGPGGSLGPKEGAGQILHLPSAGSFPRRRGRAWGSLYLALAPQSNSSKT